MQVFRAYLHSHEAAEVRKQMQAGAAAIAEMVPHVAEHIDDLPEMRSMDNLVSARFRVFDSTTTFLKNATATQPW